MSVLNGAAGKIAVDGGTAAASTIANWRMSISNNNAKHVASNSGGMQFSVPGVTDFTGSFDFYNNSSLGIVVPGTAYSFLGQGNGFEIKAGIMIDEVTINCDIAGGGIISGTCNFSAFGSSTAAGSDNTIYDFQAATSLTNTSVPAAYTVLGCKAQWAPISGTLGSYADIPDVQSWSLTLRSENFPYSSSSTGGVTKRTAGNKSASFSINVHQSDFTYYETAGSLLKPGTVGAAKLFTSAANSYTLLYAVANGLDPEVDIEGGRNVTGALRFDYTGFAFISGTFTRGSLVDPNSVTFWS